MTRARWWAAGALLVGVVFVVMGRSSIGRGDILNGAERLNVPGWEEPWELKSPGGPSTRLWIAPGTESNARWGVFLEVDSWPHALIARWDLGRRYDDWYDYGNLGSSQPPDLVRPNPELSTELPIASERLLCAAGDANGSCKNWQLDGRFAQHVISVFVTNESGMSHSEAIKVIQQVLVAIAHTDR